MGSFNTKSSYLDGKQFIKIPNDLFNQTEDTDLYYPVVFYDVLINETRSGISRISIGDILYNVLGYKENKNKPKVALNYILKALERMKAEGYIEFIDDPYSVKIRELIQLRVLKRSLPDSNYTELYYEEFADLMYIINNSTHSVSFVTLMHFYVYVKGQTYNGTRSYIKSAERIGDEIGISKDSANLCVNLLCSGNKMYTALLSKDVSYPLTGESILTRTSFSLNMEFKKK